MFSRINDTASEIYDDLITGKEPDPALSDKIINFLKSKRIIIYGAGRSGKMLRNSFGENGISINNYVDRNFEQIGPVEGIPVLAPSSIKEHDASDDVVLIIAAGTMQLAKLIEEDIRKLHCRIPTVNGLLLVYIFQYLLCKSRQARGIAPHISECTSYHVKPYKCPLFCKHVEKLALRDNPCYEAEGSSFNEFGYLVSEVCSLECKHCLEAVPYLPNKEILPKEVILKDIRKMVNACRFLHRLDLVGGEPFLHPEFTLLVGEILKIERIGYIGIFTNGTVVPDDILCRTLKNPRIIVTVANYGETLPEKFREKIFLTLEKLREHDVQYFHYSDRYWFDINAFELNNATNNQLAANYANCFLAACRRMYDGRLFHCPYQCNGDKLRKFNGSGKDCLDIHNFTDEELVIELDKFEKVPFINACRYCSIPTGAAEVTAGEQL